jgi:hypothetical protein
MKALLAFALTLLALTSLATPAHAQTTSVSLDALAKTLEQSPASSTLNSKLLSALREPVLTIEGRTLPSTAAQYTTSVETALKLKPTGWIYAVRETPATTGATCTSRLSTNQRVGYVTMETFAWGNGTCAAVMSASIARAWAHLLRLRGR